MKRDELPPDFLAQLAQVTGKRSRIVVDHILEHGFITTETLENVYGYRHPPRAVRDVREQGIPIETFRVKNEDGQTIAAYRFGNPEKIEKHKLGGRKTFSKQLKQDLLKRQASRCAICNTSYESRYLQIDHRIPYEVAGDSNREQVDDYQLLCATCNRAKSWSCEHCDNLAQQNMSACESCYWASPQNYTHLALRPIRRVDLIFTDEEIELYDSIQKIADEQHKSLSDTIKLILKRNQNDTS